jgi:DNA (cytosine-5)-methyltransferase 1
VADLVTVEMCAGAGGQALGLEQAGYTHTALIENNADACATLRANAGWTVLEQDVRDVDGRQFAGVDLLAGGPPCSPFTSAGQQLGAGDKRDVFPEAIRLTREARPRAVMLENVPGLADKRFAGYRAQVLSALHDLGYQVRWDILQASGFGVPQLRPRLVLIALRPDDFARLIWPAPAGPPPTVGDTLHDLMAADGWPGARAWRDRAQGVAPTLVGGSHKHGGADLGPTRAKQAWHALGVDGGGVADHPPGPGFPPAGLPKLTLRMTARIQGFPDSWRICGLKTAAYRQIGNALPPQVAAAAGAAIAAALTRRTAAA